MLGQNDINHILELSFEEQRLYFLQHSAGFQLAVQKIFNVPKGGRIPYTHSLQELVHVNDDYIRGILKEYRKKGRIAYNLYPSLSALPVYIAGYDYFPEGFYIKVEPYTRENTVMRAFTQIQEDCFAWNKSKVKPVVRLSKSSKEMKLNTEKIKFFLLTEKTILDTYNKVDIDTGEKYKKIITEAYLFAGEEYYHNKKGHYLKDLYYSILGYFHLPSFLDYYKLLN